MTRSETPLVTRFAPSPTGLLHLGHAYAAIFAHDLARASGGAFYLRLEDIDIGRCRPEFEAAIVEDLAWLGLSWDGPVRRQSEHVDLYRARLDGLSRRGAAYPCFCTRKEIETEVLRMGRAPHGPEGPVYPGTCRHLSPEERRRRIDAGEPHAWRLDIAAAVKSLAKPRDLAFEERGRGPAEEHGQIGVDPFLFGDIVLGRKDLGVSYHLAVTLDDHLQGVTLVTRGQDLFPATHVQRLLQALLGFDSPVYHHHRLILHESGRRLAKRDRDLTLRALRESGVAPAAVRERLALTSPASQRSA